MDVMKPDTALEIGGHRVVVGEQAPYSSPEQSDHPHYFVTIDGEAGRLTVYRCGIIKWSLFKSGKYVPELYKNGPTTVVIEEALRRGPLPGP